MCPKCGKRFRFANSLPHHLAWGHGLIRKVEPNYREIYPKFLPPKPWMYEKTEPRNACYVKKEPRNACYVKKEL